MKRKKSLRRIDVTATRDSLALLRADFDALIKRMQTREAKAGVDALFAASGETVGALAQAQAKRDARAMDKLQLYHELDETAKKAAQDRITRELEILAILESFDKELVDDGLDLMQGDRQALAGYLAEPLRALGGATCYQMLAAGNRARVIQLFGSIRAGSYL
jgi:hypothetical protein